MGIALKHELRCRSTGVEDNPMSVDSLKDFSIVLPLHDEEEILPYTFPRLLALGAKELVVVLDRCTDQTPELVQRIWEITVDPKPQLVVVVNETRTAAPNHVNYLYHRGIEKATASFVLLVQADILMDLQIGDWMPGIAEGKMASFEDVGHPHDTPYNSVITRLLRMFPRIGKILGVEGFAGTLAFSKAFYVQFPFDQEKFYYDTYYHRVAKKLGIYRFIRTRSYNLRNRRRVNLRFDGIMWRLGVEKQRKGSSCVKVFVYSLLRLNPSVMVGWFHSKLATRK